jgi:hypothetical protein
MLRRSEPTPAWTHSFRASISGPSSTSRSSSPPARLKRHRPITRHPVRTKSAPQPLRRPSPNRSRFPAHCPAVDNLHRVLSEWIAA